MYSVEVTYPIDESIGTALIFLSGQVSTFSFLVPVSTSSFPVRLAYLPFRAR